MRLRICSSTLSPGNSSSTGTISGGRLTMRGAPSTRCVSFDMARRWSLARAPATRRLNALRSCRVTRSPAWSRMRATSSRAYQSSRLRIVANSRIASRYERTAASTVAPCRRLQAQLAAGDRDARREPLDVPLPGTAGGLVEVVDVEDQLAVRCREAAEVRQVRVPAQLDRQARVRRLGEVGRHQRGRAAEERERRREHPPVPDRHELGHPIRGLLEQHLLRRPALAWRLPRRVTGSRDARARLLAARRALLHGRMRDAPRPVPAPLTAIRCHMSPAGRTQARVRAGVRR